MASPSQSSQRSRSRDRGRRSGDSDERMRRARAAQAAAVEASRQVIDRAAARRDERWREAASENRRRALLVVFVPFLLGVVVLALGVLVTVLLFVGAVLVVAWGAIAALSWRAAVSGPRGATGAVSLAEATSGGSISRLSAERYEDVAESLCAALGLALPELGIVIDDSPNAIATGTGPERASLIVTSGLLNKVERIELEAVLAHELSHMKRMDTLSGGLSAALLHGGSLPLPGMGRLALWLEGPERELEADLAAVQVTRYPPGLIGALDLARREGASVPAAVPARVATDTARQWLVPGAPRDGAGAPTGASEPAFGLEERLEVLLEL